VFDIRRRRIMSCVGRKGDSSSSYFVLVLE
jgi:hypothetical protein